MPIKSFAYIFFLQIYSMISGIFSDNLSFVILFTPSVKNLALKFVAESSISLFANNITNNE